MNIAIFASDAKHLSYLNGIIKEVASKNLNLFAMICQDTQLRYPLHHKDRFQILTNCDPIEPIFSETLGVTLPFKPDWLLVSRERWNPETSILLEFKQKFNCNIGLIEPNSYILSNAETKLENQSKNNYTSLIDVYFVHSEHSKHQQQTAGFNGNMVVVGNPKYDTNITSSPDTITGLKNYYKVDESKEQVLLFSLVNRHREDINKLYEEIIKSNPHKQYFYKPYPGEPFDPKFSKDFFPKFFLENCTPILEENHIWGMFNICDTHIGCISSIVHATLLLNKKYIDLSKKLGIDKKYLEIEFKENPTTSDIDAKIWMRTFNLTSIEQLNALIPQQYIDNIKINNNKVWDILNTPQNLLPLFDSYNDYKAGKRILKYITNENVERIL